MNKRTLAMILLILPVLAIGYAVYRSTSEIISTEENGRQVIYGEPQHGLTLGLCIFAGLSLLSSVLLLIEDWRRNVRDDHTASTTRTGSKVATNYPH